MFDRAHFYGIVDPAWSLGVEAVFYLFLTGFGPLAYLACGRLRTRRRRVALLAGGVLLLAAASEVYKWVAYGVERVSFSDLPTYWGPIAKLDTFAAGMLVAVAWVASDGRSLIRGRAAGRLILLGTAIVTLAFLLRFATGFGWVYFSSLCGLGFALALAASVLGPRSRSGKWAGAAGVLQALGVISYSLYLWHKPLLLAATRDRPIVGQTTPGFVLTALAFVAASVVVAALSYWLIERPAMRLRRRFTPDGRLATAPRLREGTAAAMRSLSR